MTVLPVLLAGGNVQLMCSQGHVSSVAASAIARPASGTFATVIVSCPTCGETTAHPITGGADQPSVQAVFLAMAAAGGCPCGALAAGKAAPLVRSHLRQHAQQLGAGFVA